MNILLVTADSLRADRTSLFDHRYDTTPFLSSLAEAGFVFETAYANGHNTAASFPAIHCSTYGSVFEGIGIPETGSPTLAEAVGSNRDTFGITTNELLSRDYNYDRGFDTYVDARSDGDGGVAWRRAARRALGHGLAFDIAKRLHFFTTETFGVKVFDTADSMSSFSDRLLRWIDGRRGPWFAWAHYMNAHHPYEPPVDLQRDLGLEAVPKRRATKLSRKMRRHPAQLQPSEADTLRDLYDGAVYSFDRELEALVDRLSALGHLEETVVVVTADHGELLGDDGLWGHPPVLRQPLLRVPLVLSGPVEPGREAAPVPLVDLAPTLLTLAGRDVPGTYRGESRFDQDGTARPPAGGPIVAETANNGPRKICAIQGDSKLVYGIDEETWEPFRLTDRGFSEDPADEIAPDLRSTVTDHLAWTERNRARGATVGEDQLEDDLKALGYLE